MFFLPSLAAALMGLAAKGTYMGLNQLIESNVICLIPSMIVAVCVYAAAVLKFGAIKREQLLGFPKGDLIVRIAGKCHLLNEKK